MVAWSSACSSGVVAVDTDDRCRTFFRSRLLVRWSFLEAATREPYNCCLFAVKVSILDNLSPDAYLRGRA